MGTWDFCFLMVQKFLQALDQHISGSVGWADAARQQGACIPWHGGWHELQADRRELCTDWLLCACLPFKGKLIHGAVRNRRPACLPPSSALLPPIPSYYLLHTYTFYLLYLPATTPPPTCSACLPPIHLYACHGTAYHTMPALPKFLSLPVRPYSIHASSPFRCISRTPSWVNCVNWRSLM